MRTDGQPAGNPARVASRLASTRSSITFRSSMTNLQSTDGAGSAWLGPKLTGGIPGSSILTEHPVLRVPSGVLSLILFLLGSPAWTVAAADQAPPDWMAWRERRKESVAGTNGWITLIGLHWLREGPTSIGTDPAND